MNDGILRQTVQAFFSDVGNPATEVLAFPALKPDRRLARIRTINGSRYFAKMFDGPTDRYARERDCLTRLAVGIAPQLYHADDVNALLITEELDAQSMHKHSASCDFAILEECALLFVRTLDLPVEHQPASHRTLLSHYLGPTLASQAGLTESSLLKIADAVGGLPRIPCHRDFHPMNILISTGREVRLIDFESYGEDTPLLDIAKFCFNPSLPLLFSDRVRLVTTFRNELKRSFALNFGLDQLALASSYWAACCAGFYLRNYPRESEDGGPYHDLVRIPLQLSSQLRELYL